MEHESEIVVGLDIGTTKVSAVVGEVDGDGITILGVGNVPCRGLRKGVVSNIDWTVRSIKDAIEAAQTMAGVEIRTVYAGVAGSHIRSQTSDGVAAIAGGEVTRADVERVLEGARAIPVDADRQILHVLPREYIVDNQDGIRDPIGMSGVRLGAKVNLVTAATSCVQNVIRCAERCGLIVADVVLEPLASAEAVLSRGREGDRRRGHRHRRRHHRPPPLRRRRHRPHERHPRRRQQHHERHRRGPPHADGRGRAPQAHLRLRARPHGRRRRGDRGPRRRRPRAAPRRAPRALATSSSRASRRSSPSIRKRIEDTGLLEQLSAGVVLTGGAVLLEGMTEFAEEILGMPVRIGFPVGVKGITQLVQGPQYATGVGLVKFGAQSILEARVREEMHAARAVAFALALARVGHRGALGPPRRRRRASGTGSKPRSDALGFRVMQAETFRHAAEIIAPLAPRIEASRGLPKEALDALAQSGVFALAIPRAYGGAEADIATLVDALETIARADGSAGWVAMIVSTSATMSMLIDDAEAKAIYGKPGAITCGVTAPMGIATKVDGGYRVTGRWPFASGCEISTHRMGGAIVAGDAPLPNGMPDVRCMLFDASQTRVHDTWHTSGLRGTGSHDIEVEDVFVPHGRSFSLVTTAPRRASGVCAMPFFGMLATSVAAVAIGIARGAVDAFVDLATKKQPLGAKRTIAHRELVQNDVARADASIRAAHASLIASATAVENDASIRARAELRATCVHATKSAADAVDLPTTPPARARFTTRARSSVTSATSTSRRSTS